MVQKLQHSMYFSTQRLHLPHADIPGIYWHDGALNIGKKVYQDQESWISSIDVGIEQWLLVQTLRKQMMYSSWNLEVNSMYIP